LINLEMNEDSNPTYKGANRSKFVKIFVQMFILFYKLKYIEI